MATPRQVNSDIHYFWLNSVESEHPPVPRHPLPDDCGRVSGYGTAGGGVSPRHNSVRPYYALRRHDGSL